MSETYKKFTKSGSKVQVESAIRDGEGVRIDTNYAKQNAKYPTLTAGNADQLNSSIFVNDKVPYLFRTSGGDADIGNREYDKIIGGSLVVNQYARPLNSTYWSGYTNITDGVATFTATNQYGGIYEISRNTTVVGGHSYLLCGEIKLTTATTNVKLAFTYRNSEVEKSKATSSTTNWQNISFVFSVVNTYNDGYLQVFDNRSSGWDAVQAKNIILVDLTQMFGTTIANYIATLESNNAGAGVAWFRNYFQETYYPYNVGGIKSVKLTSHDMVGFNQWDEEWELGIYNSTTGQATANANRIRSKSTHPIKVFSNTTYYAKCTSPFVMNIFFYDKDDNFVNYLSKANETFTTPNNCSYIRFYVGGGNITTYNNDICINLSWSGWRNGQYEEYVKNSYPLDTSIELRGIPKLDGDNKLYFDGDEYTSDGKVLRRYGTYTFTGEETLNDRGTTQAGAQIYVVQTDGFIDYKFDENNSLPAISNKGQFLGWVASTNDVQQSSYTKGFVFYNRNTHYVYFIGYTLQEIVGLTIYYELATTTEENAQPFQDPQIVDDFGTEQYVVPTQDGWQIPVGHDTNYPANLRDKLQRLPDMPSVSQNVTETYVVNYNGTTKKCSFVSVDTWLGENGYVKQEDLSSGIEPYEATGLTFYVKKAYKTGNIVNLTLVFKNATGADIPASTSLASVASGLYNTTRNLEFPCFRYGNISFLTLSQYGNLSTRSAIANGNEVVLCVSYAVA